jgi:hypothetical protein
LAQAFAEIQASPAIFHGPAFQRIMPLPGKFEDISKTAASVLDDDFLGKDAPLLQLKTKNKTNLDGANSELVVDLFRDASKCATPAKVTLKFPKPFGFQGCSIDKLEFDQKGAVKLESTMSRSWFQFMEFPRSIDGFKLEVKADAKAGALSSLGMTYTGIKDTTVKLSTKSVPPADYEAELLRGVGDAVVGLKLNNKNLCPNVGVSYKSGPLFVSVFAKDTFSVFTPHLSYKATDDLTIAATGDVTKQSGSVGGVFKFGEITAKAKIDSNKLLSCAFKKDLAKGFNFNGGFSYDLASGNSSYGAKVSIE